MDVSTALRRCIGHEEECLETIEDTSEGMQIATFLEVGLYLIEIFS